MMGAMIKRNLQLVGMPKLIILLLGSLIFAFSSRISNDLTFEQHFLSLLTDHYYLIYFVIPLFLFMCLSVAEDDNEIVVMRFGSYARYFFIKLVSLGGIALLFCAVQMTAILFSGIGLPFGNIWTLADGAVQAELFSILSTYFNNPVLCLTVAALYLLFGLLVIALYCMWVVHFFTKKTALKILIAMYVFTACSIKISFLQDLPLTGFQHILILHHNFTANNRLLITAVSILALIVCIIWSVKRHWQFRFALPQKRAKGITPYYTKKLLSKKNLSILVFVSLILFIFKSMSVDISWSATDMIIRMFTGHGIGHFSVFALMEMLLEIGCPIYLLASFIENVTANHSSFITIRLKHRFALLFGVLIAAIVLLFAYGAILIVLPLAGLSVFGFSWGSEMASLLFSCVWLRLLDIFLQFLFILAVYCFTRQVTVGFITLIGLNLFCLIPSAITAFLPFGLSSMARISSVYTDGGIPIGYAYFILITASLILFLWLCLFGHKKLQIN